MQRAETGLAILQLLGYDSIRLNRLVRLLRSQL